MQPRGQRAGGFLRSLGNAGDPGSLPCAMGPRPTGLLALVRPPCRPWRVPVPMQSTAGPPSGKSNLLRGGPQGVPGADAVTLLLPWGLGGRQGRAEPLGHDGVVVVIGGVHVDVPPAPVLVWAGREIPVVPQAVLHDAGHLNRPHGASAVLEAFEGVPILVRHYSWRFRRAWHRLSAGGGASHGANSCSESHGFGATGRCEPGRTPGKGRVGSRPAGRRGMGATTLATDWPAAQLCPSSGSQNAGETSRGGLGSSLPFWGMGTQSCKVLSYNPRRQKVRSQSPRRGTHLRTAADCRNARRGCRGPPERRGQKPGGQREPKGYARYNSRSSLPWGKNIPPKAAIF